MRNIKFFVVLMVLVVLTTSGCVLRMGKSQTLVCKQTSQGVDIQFNVGFKGNKIETMDFSYDMDLSSYNDAQISSIEKEDLCSAIKTSMSEYSSAFSGCKQNIENKHLRVDAILDVDKLANNVMDKYASPNAAKAELEKQDYKCEFK